jgi:hypothetical protein
VNAVAGVHDIIIHLLSRWCAPQNTAGQLLAKAGDMAHRLQLPPPPDLHSAPPAASQADVSPGQFSSLSALLSAWHFDDGFVSKTGLVILSKVYNYTDI